MESGAIADIKAATCPNFGYGGSGFGFGNGIDGIIALGVLGLIFGGGFGGGFGGFGGGGALGFGAIYGAQQFNQLDNGIRSVQNGIYDSTFNLNNSVKDGFYSVNSNLSNALSSTTYELAGKIDQLGFNQQNCCCQTQRAIDSVNYNMSQNTCAITNAIHAEAEATRAQIMQNKYEALKDQNIELHANNAALKNELSQLGQTQYLINELRPVAKPMYRACNPNGCGNCSGCDNFS